MPRIVVIDRIVDENPTVKTFFFKHELDYEPGQFIMLWLPGMDEKPFSVSFLSSEEFGVTIEKKGKYTEELHKLKTEYFMEIIESGQLPLRPGVARFVDEAIAADVALAICSTSHERAVNLVAEILLGPERKARFSTILAGDVVSKKKPDPEIYNLA